MENFSSVRPTEKFPEKGSPFSRLERSKRNFAFHLHVSRSLYQFQVHGKKICHGQFAKQNVFLRAFTHVPVHSLFFCCPPPNDQRHTGKTVQRSSSHWKHCARKPLWKTTNSSPVPGFGICNWFTANLEVMRSVLGRFNVTLSIQRVRS